MPELAPNHLTDDEIRICAQGEADDDLLARVSAHLDACGECRDRVDAFALTDPLSDRLRESVNPANAPSLPSVEVLERGLREVPLLAIGRIARAGAGRLAVLPDGVVNGRTTLGQVGPYRLVRKIGEGGMGAVYLAEQETPVRRRVALKVIKPGMDSAQVIARFNAERQALAQMNHPHIAQVFEAGATDDGRPYFVMELVEGVSITDYLDEARLSLHDRLGLFVGVCQAIQHAHEKGLIHRDIKPSNVLVSVCEGTSTVKVIDFGVAKSTSEHGDGHSSFTQQGWLVGTPEYMSPEQIEIGQNGVDTRSDIYALGILLYEILTGTTPLDRSWVRGASPTEIIRRVECEHFPPPSRRLEEAPERLALIAERRAADPRSLVKLVRGELDWVVMKALEKNRALRYDSASAFARDIERYLAGEPVEAHEPTPLYRLRKFAGKHRPAIVTAAAFVALLIGAAAVSATLAVRADAARRMADQGRAAAERALAESERARAQTETIKKFLVEVFRLADPSHGRKDVKVAELLDWEVANLDARFPDSPVIRGELLHVAGEAYVNLGDLEKGIVSLRRAAEIRLRALGPDHLDTLRTQRTLAHALQTTGHVEEAVKLARDADHRYVGVHGTDREESLACRVDLVMTELCRDQPESVLPLAEQTVRRCIAILGPNHVETQRARNALGLAYWQAGRGYDAIPWLDQAVRGFQALGLENQPDAFKARNNLGLAYLAVKRPEDAMRIFEETARLGTNVLGPDHDNTLFYRWNLALAQSRCGRLEEAIKTGEDVAARLAVQLGPSNKVVAICHGNLRAWRRNLDALNAVIARVQADVAPPAGTPKAMADRLDLARALRVAHRHEQAKTEARAVYETSLRGDSGQAAFRDDALNLVLASLHRWGQVEQAAAEFRTLLDVTRQALGDQHLLTRRIAAHNLSLLIVRRHPDPHQFLACLRLLLGGR